jgi:hypothetical protein
VARNAGNSCMHPPYPCRKARRSRKGGGSVAWWEKARGSEATKRDRVSIRCAWRKLDCLNLSPHGVRYHDVERWLVTAYWEVAYDMGRSTQRRHENYKGSLMLQPPQRAPYRGIKGTNETPKHIASLSYRNCGIAYTGDEQKPTPAWRRRLHITQGGPVMGSAASHRLDRHGYKRMVTTRESPSVWEEGSQPVLVKTNARAS